MTVIHTFQRRDFTQRESRLCFFPPPMGSPDVPRPPDAPPPPGEGPREGVPPDAIDASVNTQVNAALNGIRERVTVPLITQAINRAYAAIIAQGMAEAALPPSPNRVMALYLQTPRGKEAFAAAVQRNLERRSVRGYQVTVAPDGNFQMTRRTETINATDSAPMSIERMPSRFQNLARRYVEGMRDPASFSPVEKEYIENAFMQQGLTINDNGTATPAQGSFGRGLIMLVGLFRGLAWEMQNGRNSQSIRTRLEGRFTPRDYVAEYNGNPNRLANISVSAVRQISPPLRPGEAGPPQPVNVQDVTLTPLAVSGQTAPQIGTGLSRALESARIPGVSLDAATGVVTVRESTAETLRAISTVLQRLATPNSTERTEAFRAGKEKTIRDSVAGVSTLPEAGKEGIRNAITLTRGTDGKYTASIAMGVLEAAGAMPAPALAEIRTLFATHDATINKRSTPAIAEGDLDAFIANLQAKIGTLAVLPPETVRANLQRDLAAALPPGVTDLAVSVEGGGKFGVTGKADIATAMQLQTLGTSGAVSGLTVELNILGTSTFKLTPRTEPELRALIARLSGTP